MKILFHLSPSHASRNAEERKQKKKTDENLLFSFASKIFILVNGLLHHRNTMKRKQSKMWV